MTSEPSRKFRCNTMPSTRARTCATRTGSMRPASSVVSATDSGAMVTTPTSGGGGAPLGCWRPQPAMAINASEAIPQIINAGPGCRPHFCPRLIKFAFISSPRFPRLVWGPGPVPDRRPGDGYFSWDMVKSSYVHAFTVFLSSPPLRPETNPRSAWRPGDPTGNSASSDATRCKNFPARKNHRPVPGCQSGGPVPRAPPPV